MILKSQSDICGHVFSLLSYGFLHDCKSIDFMRFAVGRVTLETTFDKSDLPQSRFVRSSPLASSTPPHRQCLYFAFSNFSSLIG